ncbi:hypothetical protein JST97_22415 [bacterium]|nr:hypothetical protein [bacterium]
MKKLLFWLGLLLCLGVPNALVVYQERARAGSVVVYLRIAPQGVQVFGNRVSLSYDLNLRPLDPGWPGSGYLRPDMDSRRVVNAWAPDSSGIRYELHDQRIWLGDHTLNVPDGKYSDYLGARYAKFDLTPEGKLILRGLVDSTLTPL